MWTIEETEEIKQLRHGVMINRWYAIMPSGRFWHLAETKYSDSFINQSHNYSLVWKETPAALATRKFNWVVTISRILNKQAKNPASHTQILASPASRRAVNSRIPSRYLSRFPHRIYFGQIGPDPENTLPDPGNRAVLTLSRKNLEKKL